jgi:hypothetical protein
MSCIRRVQRAFSFIARSYPYTLLRDSTERRGDVAMYTQTHKASGTIRYEVIKIKVQAEHTWPNGVTTPEKEAYPGSGSWGRDGWTFFALAPAQQKMSELLASAADDPPQSAAVEDVDLQ